MVYRLILLRNQLLRERNKYLQNIQFTKVDAYAKIQAQTNNYAHFCNLIKPMCRNGGIGRRKGLKIPRWKHRIGSTPIFGTNKKSLVWVIFLFSHNRGLTCPVTRLAYKSAIADGRPYKRFSAPTKKNHLRLSLVVFCLFLFCHSLLYRHTGRSEQSRNSST